MKRIPSVFMYVMNIQNDVTSLLLRQNCTLKQVTDFITWPSRCRDTIYDYHANEIWTILVHVSYMYIVFPCIIFVYAEILAYITYGVVFVQFHWLTQSRANVSGLSILDCLFGFLYVLFDKHTHLSFLVAILDICTMLHPIYIHDIGYFFKY